MESPEYDAVPDLILANVPALASAPSYQLLTRDQRRVSGLVAAALTTFMEDLQHRALARTLDADQLNSLENAYLLVESLASSKDIEVQNLVVTEILENIRAEEAALREMLSRFGPNTASLYRRWIERSE